MISFSERVRALPCVTESALLQHCTHAYMLANPGGRDQDTMHVLNTSEPKVYNQRRTTHLAGDASLLELIEGEATAGAHAGVVLVGGATHNGAGGAEGAGGNGGSPM